MKTAEERARLALEMARDPAFQTERDRLDEIAMLFKEYARDQRHICAEAVQDRSYADASYRVADAVHEAVMNAPFPGE